MKIRKILLCICVCAICVITAACKAPKTVDANAPANKSNQTKQQSIATREIKDDELLAAVQDTRTKKYGFMDTTGQFVIPPMYEYAHNFSEGLAFVHLGGNVVIIDKSGKVIKDLGSIVTSNDIDKKASSTYFIKSGVYVGGFGNATFSFKEGLASVAYINYGDKYQKVGYIDRNGNKVFNQQFLTASDFVGGIARVATSQYNGWSKKWTYIDKKGNYLFPPTFEIGDFHEGLSYVINGDILSGKTGYTNIKGDIVIPYQFDSASNFSEGYACVTNEKGKIGYINTKGELVIPYKFSAASDFSEGYACVTEDEDADKDYYVESYFIDKKGNRISSEGFSQSSTIMPYALMMGAMRGVKLNGGIAYAVINGKPGYVDVSGKPVFFLTEEYNYNIQNDGTMQHGFAFISTKDKTDRYSDGYLIDKKGAIIARNIYKELKMPLFGYVNKPEEAIEHPLVESTLSQKIVVDNLAPIQYKYNQLKNGMPYKDVCEIMGSQGEQIILTQYQAQYKFRGEGGSVTVEFFNGKVYMHKPIKGEPSSSTQSTIKDTQTNEEYSSLENLILQGDKRYYTDKDLSDWSKEDLSIIRNGLYAISGKRFQNQEITNYFNQFTWYTPDTTDDGVVKARWNDYQRANLDKVMYYENN